jgi:hypothetical protein
LNKSGDFIKKTTARTESKAIAITIIIVPSECFLKNSEKKKTIAKPKETAINTMEINKIIALKIKKPPNSKAFPIANMRGIESIIVAQDANIPFSNNLIKNIFSVFIGVVNRNSSSGVRKKVVIEVIMLDIKSIRKNIENMIEVRRCAMLYPIPSSVRRRKTKIL